MAYNKSSPLKDQMDTTIKPVNPFKEIRNQQGISQYELSSRAKVSKHAILRLEQGMYAEPLPTLVNYFSANYHMPRRLLLANYSQFQVETRVNTGKLFGFRLTKELSDRPVGAHPLRHLREKLTPPLNQTEVAKRLCISQTVVTYFETRPVNQKTVPEQLLVALKDSGYTDEDLEALQDHYASYRQELIRSQNVRFDIDGYYID